MQFRQQALSKLQSPEELDLPVRFARPQGWLVLCVTVVVMAAASFWAVTGSVSSTVSAPGILTHARGSYVLQSPVAGQVTGVLAEQGQNLAAGAPLLEGPYPAGGPGRTHHRSRPGDRADGRHRSGSRGRSRRGERGAQRGRRQSAGGDAVRTRRQRCGCPGRRPRRPHGPFRAGPAVRGAAGQGDRGRRVAQTRQQISGFLGDSQLGEQFSQHGRPLAVLVRLDRSSATKSGYRWSSADGPPYPVDSMTLTTGSVHLADQRPIDWLLP